MKTLKDFTSEARESVGSIGPEDAYKAAEIDAIILDVREAGELGRDGRIPGATHVPRGSLELRADAQASPDERLTGAKRDGRRVLTLCGGGTRALLAAATLRQMGYDAAVIEGGMKAWKVAGLPVEG